MFEDLLRDIQVTFAERYPPDSGQRRRPASGTSSASGTTVTSGPSSDELFTAPATTRTTGTAPPPRIATPLGSLGGPPPDAAAVGRNDPCPCGSGKKYKKCHGVGA